MKSIKISGIYKIINKVNGKYYVGSSDNIKGVSGRWMEHIRMLKTNVHHNSYLQRAWNKYGEQNFEFIVLEEVKKDTLFIVEQTYLDKAKLDGKSCYNLNFTANGGSFVGHKHTKESKRKISEKLKGRVVTDETRKRLSDSLQGRIGGFVGKTQSEKWKKNHSQVMKMMWQEKRQLDPMYGKGTNHVQHKQIDECHMDELKQCYLTQGSMLLYHRGRELGYGKGIISRFIRNIKTKMGIPFNVHLTDKRHGNVILQVS